MTDDDFDPEAAGWGVVWGPGTKERLRRQLEPLLDLRRDQAGKLYRELEYRAGETYVEFLSRVGGALAPIDPERLPLYLLLIGDPHDMPFDFQFQLDLVHAVGRLSFATPVEYRRYAEGVVRAEGKTPRRRLTVFSPRSDDDRLTESCNRHLARPLAAGLAARHADWRVERSCGERATKTALRRVCDGEPPSLLLTCGHGVMFEAGDPLQPSDQGALLCADWPGPRKWKRRLPPEFYLSAGDIADDMDLTGVVTFHFGCFSAGTPERDSFSRDSGRRARRLTTRDMIAPLARRLLGKPGGTALAVVGHVDQVWEASYLWPLAGRQRETFEACFQALLDGRPIGAALSAFSARHAMIAVLITDLLEQRRRDPRTRPASPDEDFYQAFLWLAHNDARGYLLLGDPAVRLAA